MKRVYSVKNEGILRSLGVDTPDIFLTTIEFANGGIAHMENGWVTPNGNGNVNDFRCSVLFPPFPEMFGCSICFMNIIH